MNKRARRLLGVALSFAIPSMEDFAAAHWDKYRGKPMKGYAALHRQTLKDLRDLSKLSKALREGPDPWADQVLVDIFTLMKGTKP